MLCFCLCLILGVLFPSIEQAVFGSWLRDLEHDAVVKDAVVAPALLQAGMAAGVEPLVLTPDSNYPFSW